MATLKSDLSLHNLTFEDAIELALDKSLSEDEAKTEARALRSRPRPRPIS